MKGKDHSYLWDTKQVPLWKKLVGAAMGLAFPFAVATFFRNDPELTTAIQGRSAYLQTITPEQKMAEGLPILSIAVIGVLLLMFYCTRRGPEVGWRRAVAEVWIIAATIVCAWLLGAFGWLAYYWHAIFAN